MDPIPLLITLALVILPGIGAAMTAFRPGEASIPIRLASVFGGGYAVVGIVSTILVLGHVLTRTTFVTAWVVVTVGLWYVGLKRARPSERFKGLLADFRSNPWVMGAGSLFFVLLLSLLLDYSPLINFGVSNPFRYWADGVEIANLGHIPEASLQWGAAYRPAISKLIFNSFDAGVTATVAAPLTAIGAVTMIAVVGSPVAIWAVATEMGFRYSAPVLPVVMTGALLESWLAFSPAAFAGESFGLMVSLSALALSIHALGRSGWKAAIWPGVVFGAAAGIHLVPTSVMLMIFAWYVIARGISERRFRELAVTSLTIAGIAAGIAGSALVLSRGDIGWGATDQRSTYDTHGGRFDPTLYLAGGNVDQKPGAQPGTRSENNGGWYSPPSTVLEAHAEKSTRFWALSIPGYVLMAVLGIAAVTMLLWFPRELRPIGLTASGFWITLLGAGLLFSFLYETYIPGKFPERRLFGYGSLALILVGMALLEVLLVLLSRVRPWVAGLTAASLVVIGSITLVIPLDLIPEKSIANGRETHSALNWTRENIPCDARILVSQRTGGIFQLLTGRAAVTEGLAPFLRPDVSRPVVQLLLDARKFFHDPIRHEEFLTEQGIDYVIVAKKTTLFDARPPLLGPIRPRTLTDVPFLSPVHTDELMDVYSVERVPENNSADVSETDDFPGYSCSRHPLPPL